MVSRTAITYLSAGVPLAGGRKDQWITVMEMTDKTGRIQSRKTGNAGRRNVPADRVTCTQTHRHRESAKASRDRETKGRDQGSCVNKQWAV
jgi:hypothetical protein